MQHHHHVPSSTNQDVPDEETPKAVVTAQAGPSNEKVLLEKPIQEKNIGNAKPIKSSMSIVESSGGEGRDSKMCGIPRKDLPFVVLILLLIVGGVIAGIVVASKPGNETTMETSSENSQDTANQTVLQQQLERWIIRTDQDRRPFDESNSPQSRALQWLATDDYTAQLLSKTNSTQEKLQRYALAVFYYSTDGPNWKQLDVQFLTSRSICDWQNGEDVSGPEGRGIDCSGSTSSPLLSIGLRNMGLAGTIPWELSLLSGLESIFLTYNALEGPIPPEISKLNNLRSLCLSSNLLTGSLPEELPASLISLEVSGNPLTGTIPSAWGKSLPNLGFLNLQSNFLSGSLPSEISNLQALTFLSLFGNDLTGTIPTEFSQFSSMEALSVGLSSLTGTIPTELGNLADLKFLVIYNTSISGTIPTEFGKLTSLVTLNLQYNDLTGSLPTEMAQLSNLTMFAFNHNDLIGSVEDIFCRTSTQWIQLESDCLGNSTIGDSEIDCSCCTMCCSATGDICESLVLSSD